MGNYTKHYNTYTGKELKSFDNKIEWQDVCIDKYVLIDDKIYDVIIHESYDSEGYNYKYYEIIGNHTELKKMLIETIFNKQIEEEIKKREQEYYIKQKEKYEKLPHDILVNKIIELEQTIKRVVSNIV